ncbi:MAG: hypothetical protein AB7D35_10710 [Bacteroidales bacterium]|nr:hypothetical protein [Bacteroidales bacterium]
MSTTIVLASLSHAIFCVACDSKYIDTSSSCRLESGIRQTFSADPMSHPD